MTRFKQALDGMFLMLAVQTFYFVGSFLISLVVGIHLYFSEFIEQTQLGLSMSGFWGLIVAFTLLGAIISFLVPPSSLNNDYLICRWWNNQ